MASDRTEKATPKRREEARRKGQVARSADVNGAVVLFSALLVLSAVGPSVLGRLEQSTRALLALVASPQVVDRPTIGALMTAAAGPVALACAPVVGACALAGIVANLAQVGFKPATQALRPDPKKLNPVAGAKNLFGVRALFEAGKSVAKVGVVGGIAALAVFPKLDELAALVGMPPADLLSTLAATILHVAQRGAAGYLLIAAIDYAWQRHRHEKSLKMDKQAVKDEHKQQSLPSEVKSQQRRRGMQLAQARMMDAVPTADVVVTNPTHYAVALRYDGSASAPVVVAKGQDHLAARIRERAGEAGVRVVPDPPLARALHASVEVGHMIPEELFQAVAQLLAYVYRVAGAARLAGSR
jgi:flagellar biosynthetic protein FlhB